MHGPNRHIPVLLTLPLMTLALFAASCAGEPDQAAPAQPLQAQAPDSEPAFFAIGETADRIAYVIDRSASMTDTFPAVKAGLARSIRMLKPNQLFYVVFYSSGPAVELPARKMVPAVEPNKLSAYEFIDSIEPAGQTNPNEAIEKAFAATPTIIYLMTDGEFKRSVIDLIDELNPDRKVIVNTFCVVYNSGEQVMREIASRNGGAYRHLTRSDLKKP